MSRRGASVNAEPNLTPILDMVFQLITFFMLVINFKSAEIDLTLKLPVIGSAMPQPNGADLKLLVLNVKEDKDHKVSLSIYGNLYNQDEIKHYLEREAQSSMLAAKITKEEIDNGQKELPDTVVIRADGNAQCGNVNFVIFSCQEQGYRKFAFKALPKKPTT